MEYLTHIWLTINGKRQRFHLLYGDMGTTGMARMQGNRAVGGRLTNISSAWGQKKLKGELRMLYLIGGTKHDVFSGMVWYNPAPGRTKKSRIKKERKEAVENE